MVVDQCRIIAMVETELVRSVLDAIVVSGILCVWVPSEEARFR